MPIARMLVLAFAKTFSKLFGVATITFFGRAPSRDDDKVALVGVLSLLWLFTIPAVFIPEYAEMIIPLLPDDEMLLQLLATVLVVGIPPLNGFVISRLHNRDGGAGEVAKHLVYGYGYSLALSVLVVALIVVVPVVKGSYILRRFDLQHIAVMIDRDCYDDIVEQVCEALEGHGIDTEVIDPHWTIRRLFSALVWVEGRIFRRNDMSRKMKIVRGELDDGAWFEVTVHATDISIIGQKHESSLVYAILAEDLDSEDVYFSWDDDSQEIEKRIRELRKRLNEGDEVEPEEITAVCDDLRDMELSPEEWNAIRRMLYRLEVDCYRARTEELQARAS
jgi:hypothetical protein